MTQLTRRSMASSGPRTRVLLVRQPARSVREGEPTATLPMRLAIGVIATIGGFALLWIIGLLGIELGYKPLLDHPPLRTGSLEALTAGIAALLAAPYAVYEVALREPLWFILGFLLIAIPGGGLAGARRPIPGLPEPHPLAVAFSHLGVIAAILFIIASIVWLYSPLRASFITAMPLDTDGVWQWVRDGRFVAGIDLLALIAAVLWVLLVPRLTVPAWLRAITGAAVVGGAIILTAAAATTCGGFSHLQRDRPVITTFDHTGRESLMLLLGESSHHLVVLARLADDTPTVRLISPVFETDLVGRTSIPRYLQWSPDTADETTASHADNVASDPAESGD